MRTRKPEQAERMLDAAAKLFGTQRFHEVRMEDVAAQAGVGKGTIYRYFEDKDELYLTLLERAGAQIGERIRERVEAARSSEAKLIGFAEASLSFFDEQPHIFDLIQRADAQRGQNSPWQKTRDDAVERVRALISEGNEGGEFQVADPAIAALLLLGGLRAVMRFGPRPHPPDIARRVVRMILFGASG